MSSSSFSSASDHLSFNNFLDNIIVNFPPQSPILFTPGSDNYIQTTNSSGSGSDDGEAHKRKVSPIDEGRKKRMISNRESARRSRMRKQKHLEDIKNQVTQYKTVNHQLMNRLLFVNHDGQIVEKENQTLRLELVLLQQKLYHLHQQLAEPKLYQTLLPSAWPCNSNVTTVNDHNQWLPLVI